MKNVNYLFFAIGFCLFLILFTLFNQTVDRNDKLLENSIKNQMYENMNSHSKSLNDYINNREQDLLVLSDSNRIKQMLKSELVSEEKVILDYLSSENKLIRSKVYNFLKKFPDMTLDELKKDNYFKEIATTRIGNDTYSSIYNDETREIYFSHINNRVGMLLQDVGKNEQWIISEDEYNNIGEENQHLKFFKNESGNLVKYVMIFNKINISTSDGIFMTLILMEKVSNNKDIKVVSEKNSEFIEKFISRKKLNDLVLISTNGHLIYTGLNGAKIRSNLNWINNFNRGISQSYLNFKAKNLSEITYFGPYSKLVLNRERQVLINMLSPVYDNDGTYLGSIGLILPMENIYEIIKGSSENNEFEESYLVSDIGKLISPLKYVNSTILVQDMAGINIDECFKNHEINKNISELRYLNYFGDEVLRNKKIIDKFNWCFVIDTNIEKVYSLPIETINKNNMMFLSYLSIILFLFLFLVSVFINKKYIVTERKNSINVIRLDNFIVFIRGLSIFKQILISIIIPVIYYLIVIYIIHDFKMAALYGGIPDLIITSIFFMIMFKGFESNLMKSRVYLVVGSLCYIISNIFEIIFQKLILIQIFVNPIYWSYTLLLSIIAVVLILIGFSEGEN
jgi:hypothetical protein